MGRQVNRRCVADGEQTEETDAAEQLERLNWG